MLCNRHTSPGRLCFSLWTRNLSLQAAFLSPFFSDWLFSNFTETLESLWKNCVHLDAMCLLMPSMLVLVPFPFMDF